MRIVVRDFRIVLHKHSGSRWCTFSFWYELWGQLCGGFFGCRSEDPSIWISRDSGRMDRFSWGFANTSPGQPGEFEKTQKQPFYGISYGDSEIKLCQPMLQCPQWAEYALLAVEWEKPHSQTKIPLMPAILNRLSSAKTQVEVICVLFINMIRRRMVSSRIHGMAFANHVRRCATGRYKGRHSKEWTPVLRLQRGWNPVRVKSPACVIDRSRTLLEPNALCVNFTVSEVKRQLQVKDIYRYQSWPMKR